MRKEAMSGLGIARATDFVRKAFSGFQFGQGTEVKGRFNMNKMIAFGAAALCAAVSFGDVTSANIVGYQNFPLHRNYNFTAATMLPVGKADAAMTFGDIKVNENFTFSGTTLQLLTDGGATDKVEIEDLGEVEAMFWYVDPVLAEELTVEPGWYQMDDGALEHCQNSRPLPFGQGIMLDCGDDDAAIVNCGEVKQEQKEVPLFRNYNFTANCSPVDLTFGDLTVNENFTFSGTTLQLLTDGGATDKVEIEDLGEVEAMFWYVDPVLAEELTVEPGWYQMDDGALEHCQNSRPLPAGQGIMLDCGDDDAAIIIPPAL